MSRMKTFEQKLQRLEDIVEILDRGTEPLDSLIALYKEGILLVKELQNMLEQAELEIQQLHKEGEHEHQPHGDADRSVDSIENDIETE